MKFKVTLALAGMSFVLNAQTYSSDIIRKHNDQHDTEVPGTKGSTYNSPLACTAATNDNYASATNITVGSTLTNQSTCGTLEGGELVGCGSASQSVWYTFTATASTTYVMVTTTGSCYVTTAVYSGSTLPTSYCNMITCQSASNGPTPYTIQLKTTVGVTYHIQVCYGSGGPCGSNGTFDITVSNSNPGGTLTNPAPTTSTTSPTTGCYINNPSSNPSCSTVSSNCTSYGMANGANQVYDAYYSFTTGASQSNDAQFQDCITSSCLSGNVNWMTWQLYDQSGNCVASGNLNTGLSVNNAGCSASFVLHYLFETVSCNYTSQAPFIDNYTSSTCGVLPVALIFFVATQNENGLIDLQWATASEKNNSSFTIERSSDAQHFSAIGEVKGKGNSQVNTTYHFTDEQIPASNVLYYRLRQTDNNGASETFRIIDVSVNHNYSYSLYPNPSAGDFILESLTSARSILQYEINDATGRVITSGMQLGSGSIQQQKIQLTSAGIYFVTINVNGHIERKRIIKL